MADAAILYGGGAAFTDDFKQYLDELVKHYGKQLDQPKRNQIQNVFLLTDLAITSIIYFTHHDQDPKKDEINECFMETMDDYMLYVFGREGIQEARKCLATMLIEYEEAFKGNEPFLSLSKVLQYKVESVILGLPLPGPKFAMPSIHAFEEFLAHISGFLPPLQAILNRWVIE